MRTVLMDRFVKSKNVLEEPYVSRANLHNVYIFPEFTNVTAMWNQGTNYFYV